MAFRSCKHIGLSSANTLDRLSIPNTGLLTCSSRRGYVPAQEKRSTQAVTTRPRRRSPSRQVREVAIRFAAGPSAVSARQSVRAGWPQRKALDAFLLAAVFDWPTDFCARGQGFPQPFRVTFANTPPQAAPNLHSSTLPSHKSYLLLKSKYQTSSERECKTLPKTVHSQGHLHIPNLQQQQAQEELQLSHKSVEGEGSNQSNYPLKLPTNTKSEESEAIKEEQCQKLPLHLTQSGSLYASAGELPRKLQRRLSIYGEDMTKPDQMPDSPNKSATGGHDRPLVVGRTKPADTVAMDSSKENVAVPADTKAALNHAIEKNVEGNTKSAAPADGDSEPSIAITSSGHESSSKPTTKKEKPSKQPKQPKAAPPSAPLTPALIDLRVGHILRCVTHPNADSLFVSTIAMGDPEGSDHTQVDEETGKIVRTVCSGLNGLIPIEEMQDRKIIVVANLKPVSMRGIKSAAMVLAASPKVAEGEDDHAADRTVELVMPPEGSEAGDKVYFEGWPYGEGRGPEKQLNPKKKIFEGMQPGFYTGEDLVVGFDASATEMGGEEKGDLVVEGKGKCMVKTLKGAAVR